MNILSNEAIGEMHDVTGVEDIFEVAFDKSDCYISCDQLMYQSLTSVKDVSPNNDKYFTRMIDVDGSTHLMLVTLGNIVKMN